MRWKISVGRRINVLVLSHALTMVLTIAVAAYAMKILVLDTDHMYHYQLSSAADIADHLDKAARLQQIVHPTARQAQISRDEEVDLLFKDLQKFYLRYREVWQAELADTEDAKIFRADLKRAGQLGLLDKERERVTELETSLKELEANFSKPSKTKAQPHWEAIVRVREALGALLDLNSEFAHTSNDQIAIRARETRWTQIGIGILGVLFSLILGFYVRKAIAPRIGRLVTKVSRFKEFGVNEKTIEEGDDEITVLANALDAGFSAIAERDRERDQFMAIVAHELKTPITSIQGFSGLLLAEESSPESKKRALEIINKQSWRLNRMIESLFLMMQAKSNKLKFQPAPLDLSILVHKVLGEVRSFLGEQVFQVKAPQSLKILGDEDLLSHALWNLFTCASALAEQDQTLDVVISSKEFKVRLEIFVNGSSLDHKTIDSLFVPFHTVEYENGTAARGAVGLYLSREIVRIHGGQMKVHHAGRETIFFMELSS